MTDRSTLETLYVTMARDVRRYAHWLTRDAAAADDITSETFVRAITHFDAIRTGSAKGYLLTVARNLAQAERRRHPRMGPMDPDHRDPGPDPAMRAEEHDFMATTLDAIRGLPEVEREALVLRAVEDLPYDEIARVLGISLVAAKVRVHRARARLIASTRRVQENCP